MGLAVFSFTLVIFGAAVYTTSLPSLIAVAEQNGSANSALGFLTSIGQEDGVQASGSSSVSGGATVRASGARLGSVLDMSSALADEALEDDAANGSQGGSPENPGGGATSGGGNTPGNGGGSVEEPDEGDETDPAREQAAYEFALSEFQAVEGFIPRVNECVENFNNDNLADYETRLRHQREAQALIQELGNHYTAVLNNVPLAYSQYYKGKRSELAAMYRCLSAYVENIEDAWTLNVQYPDDPASHIDEFMAPIRDAMVDGQNENLTEFLSYYEQFELVWVEP